MHSEHNIKGRGTQHNPTNRFERLAHNPVYDDTDNPPVCNVKTEYFRDTSKSIIATNDSPDIGFDMSVNAYRGCEHGCSYCYARPYHEYLGMSAGLDFESKIFVKYEAPELLKTALNAPRYVPGVIAMSGVTDCYQPGEREFRLTRGCLEVLEEFKNPVGIITKNSMVTRDIDILKAMAEWRGAAVIISITTLDSDLSGRLEPRASRPAARLETIRKLADAGVSVGVNASPMIPGLTDTELPAIVSAAANAGATFASYSIVRLPGAVESIFQAWLEKNVPNSASKVMNHIRAVHGGTPQDNRFGTRMRGDGVYAEQIKALFQASCRKAGLDGGRFSLSAEHFRRPDNGQLTFL